MRRILRDNDERDDEELVRAYQETQEQAAFAALSSRYLYKSYLVCLSYMKNEQDAEDAALDVWNSLPAKIKAHSIQQFKPWLYTVLRNHCFHLLKLAKRYQFVELTEKSGQEGVEFPHYDPLNEERDTYELLDEALEALDPEQRQCIVLFYFQDKSYRETARQMGVAEKKVKTLLQNGRRNLRNQLTKWHEKK
mgnify:CR=1 FL=1